MHQGGGKIWKKIFCYWEEYILDTIFPKECIECGTEGKWICEECLSGVAYSVQKNCIKCGKRSERGVLCRTCSSFFVLEDILAVGCYENRALGDCIKYIKYRFIKELTGDLVHLIEEYIGKDTKTRKILYENNTLMVPVPLHPHRRKWRGFNQAEEIAKSLSEKYQLPLSSQLIRRYQQRPQVELSGRERRNNILHDFKWKGEKLGGRNIIIVDDVVTTGSTLNECARVLKHHGAGRIIGLVAAQG